MKTIILGAGPAGMSAAETLRTYDTSRDISLFSKEQGQPYAPPAMLEYFLSGKAVHLWKWKDMLKRLHLNYKPESYVIALNPNEHTIHLENGATYPYDDLLIAAGSSLYTTISGAEKEGIYNFKSFQHAKMLIDAVKEGQINKVIVIGAGFIGVEIALLLSKLSVSVTLLEVTNQVMPYILDREVGEIVFSLLKKCDIEVLLGSKARAFLGTMKAEALELESGEILCSDIFVIATGIQPNVGFLQGSGVNIKRGVVVDTYLRTNKPHIYAAGDIVETIETTKSNLTNYAIFYNALVQGQVAALNMIGQMTKYEKAYRINSLKHLDLPIATAGQEDGEELRVRKKNILRKVFVKHNRIQGFQCVGDIRSAGIFLNLMNKKTDIGSIKQYLLHTGFGMGMVQNLYQSG